MKPSGQAYCTDCRYQRVSNRRPRNHSHAPTHPMAIIKTPRPTIRRKAMNTGKIGGRSSALELLQAGKAPIELVRQDEAREVRDRDLEVVALLVRVGDREEDERAGLRAVPVALDRRDLRRLIF